jgi:hypothetical protein
MVIIGDSVAGTAAVTRSAGRCSTAGPRAFEPRSDHYAERDHQRSTRPGSAVSSRARLGERSLRVVMRSWKRGIRSMRPGTQGIGDGAHQWEQRSVAAC